MQKEIFKGFSHQRLPQATLLFNLPLILIKLAGTSFEMRKCVMGWLYHLPNFANKDHIPYFHKKKIS